MTAPTTTAAAESPDLSDLRREAERLILTTLIDRFRAPGLDPAEFKKYADVYVSIRQAHAADERNRVAREVARLRAARAAQPRAATPSSPRESDSSPGLAPKTSPAYASKPSPARVPGPDSDPAADPAPAARARPRHDPRSPAFDDAAPYGRRPDGAPRSRAEFLVQLRQCVRDVYGVNLDDGIPSRADPRPPAPP